MDNMKLRKLLHSYDLEDFTIGINVAYNTLSRNEFLNMVTYYYSQEEPRSNFSVVFEAYDKVVRRSGHLMWISGLTIKNCVNSGDILIKL